MDCIAIFIVRNGLSILKWNVCLGRDDFTLVTSVKRIVCCVERGDRQEGQWLMLQLIIN